MIPQMNYSNTDLGKSTPSTESASISSQAPNAQ